MRNRDLLDLPRYYNFSRDNADNVGDVGMAHATDATCIADAIQLNLNQFDIIDMNIYKYR